MDHSGLLYSVIGHEETVGSAEVPRRLEERLMA